MTLKNIADNLEDIAGNCELMEIGRKAIEDALLNCRKSCIASLGRGNGFVIRDKDGTASKIIRFGPETGIRIALEAIAKHLAATETRV